MPVILLNLLARWGVPDWLRKPLILSVAVTALVGLLGVAKCSYDRSVIAEHEAAREAKTSAAREVAAEEQAVDTIRNTHNEKDLHDAIRSAPSGGALSPAALALNCERLRKLGRIPEACRSASGGGAEAGPH
ncbi:MAG: hypothetical protein A3E01_09160 [Gammaproteobacteria bacterium RIFCSPHIGHO2_12_FULL_63_22]|nr:MAG: hypothetical protein A3E01_09160 [Gammaproteobacteria bacterium RIFCSPHIGHO2_12_FULL_63_22]